MKETKMLCILLMLLGLLSACSAHSQGVAETAAPTWQSQYDLGVRYLSNGNYEEAILAFTAAIEIDPKNAEIYEHRGNAYWELAQSAQGSERTEAYRCAAEDYESAMRWGSETDEMYRRAADSYYGAQDYEKAESYYEKLLEKDDDALTRLIECSRWLEKENELVKQLQARYRETSEEKYLKALCELWPQEALRGYGALLGTDGTTGFALADLDENGIPELICGEIDTEVQFEQIVLTDYTLYTWQNGQVVDLYNGYVDTWRNPDVRVTTAGAIVNNGHGTSGSYVLYYVRWDGTQIEQHDFWSYAKTEDMSGERAYYFDDVEVSESVFDEHLAVCTDGDDGYVLRFLANTPENCRDYLRYDVQTSQTTVEEPAEPDWSAQLSNIVYFGDVSNCRMSRKAAAAYAAALEQLPETKTDADESYRLQAALFDPGDGYPLLLTCYAGSENLYNMGWPVLGEHFLPYQVWTFNGKKAERYPFEEETRAGGSDIQFGIFEGKPGIYVHDGLALAVGDSEGGIYYTVSEYQLELQHHLWYASKDIYSGNDPEIMQRQEATVQDYLDDGWVLENTYGDWSYLTRCELDNTMISGNDPDYERLMDAYARIQESFQASPYICYQVSTPSGFIPMLWTTPLTMCAALRGQ